MMREMENKAEIIIIIDSEERERFKIIAGMILRALRAAL